MTTKELFQKYNLARIEHVSKGSRAASRGWNSPPDPVWLATIETLKRFYGEKVRCETNYESAYIKCGEGCQSHYLYLHTEGAANYYAYSWPGQGYVASPNLLPTEVLHEMVKLKSAELEAARKKRFETIKSPRDAVRLIFRDLDIKEVEMFQGHPRLDCGPFELEFKASKDDSDPKVSVSFIYREYYVKETLLTTLTIADPNFSKKIEDIIFNGRNLSKLMLGEIQPRQVNK